jgi:hypothetical protein
MWPQTRLRESSRPALPLVSASSGHAALNWRGLRWLYAWCSGIKSGSRAAFMVSLSLTVALVLRAEKRLAAVKRRIAVKSLAASVRVVTIVVDVWVVTSRVAECEICTSGKIVGIEARHSSWDKI